ncbi:hypothetical protein H6P81_003034 [Aristolochia fimbriata]|uniref:Uncharacterized protein n=1 Tax=Aristolochia fimbriata TaxID=158543 RepID=A0AAV7FCJ7_ARIFI|nr:hypothetical protein H6P81_003034 [Aristolochia fimbriata]
MGVLPGDLLAPAAHAQCTLSGWHGRYMVLKRNPAMSGSFSANVFQQVESTRL